MSSETPQSQASSATSLTDRPELVVGAVFAGALVLGAIIKRLGS